MSEEIIVPIAAIYASMVAISYRKVGIIQSLIWPITIICVGLIVYFTIIFSSEEQNPKE